MKELGYYNGQCGPIEDLRIPFNDRVCFFGDGVYDATGFAYGKFFHFDDHLDRFYRSAARMQIEVPYSREELAQLLYETTLKVDGELIFTYWQLTRGTAVRVHKFPTDSRANLWMIIRACDPLDCTTRIGLTEMEDKRYEYCDIKTLNLMPNVLAAQKAEVEGCVECVFHRGEVVTECAHSNVSILKDGVFRTHPCDEHILPGVGRKYLIKACHTLGIPVEERAFTLDELRQADEVITSSAMLLCRSAAHFCGQPVGGRDHETVLKLQREVFRSVGLYNDKGCTPLLCPLA